MQAALHSCNILHHACCIMAICTLTFFGPFILPRYIHSRSLLVYIFTHISVDLQHAAFYTIVFFSAPRPYRSNNAYSTMTPVEIYRGRRRLWLFFFLRSSTICAGFKFISFIAIKISLIYTNSCNEKCKLNDPYLISSRTRLDHLRCEIHD